jgi:hypothetical protein
MNNLLTIHTSLIIPPIIPTATPPAPKWIKVCQCHSLHLPGYFILRHASRETRLASRLQNPLPYTATRSMLLLISFYRDLLHRHDSSRYDPIGYRVPVYLGGLNSVAVYVCIATTANSSRSRAIGLRFTSGLDGS